jgi:hypothetical protein
MHIMGSMMFVVPGKKVVISLPDPKGHVRFVITERPSSVTSSSVNFYILIFFSKGVIKGLSIYIGIHYLLLTCF